VPLAKQSLIKWNPDNFDASPFMSNGTRPTYVTAHGALFAGDCVRVLKEMQPSVVDTVFADPPFNIRKQYREGTNDNLPEQEYLEWCKTWVKECVRVLKPGGSLFIYNLPKWNIPIGAYLNEI
jgi:site-specific DNA-methyltransferase (adenine-specific)